MLGEFCDPRSESRQASGRHKVGSPATSAAEEEAVEPTHTPRWNDIPARLERLRAAADAAPPERAVELRDRMDEVRRMLDARPAEPQAAHPLGADPASAAWVLFQLDRCETLLETSGQSDRAALENVLRPTLGDALFRRGLAAVLAARGCWKRLPVACDPPSLREVLYPRLPAALALLARPWLPRRRRNPKTLNPAGGQRPADALRGPLISGYRPSEKDGNGMTSNPLVSIIVCVYNRADKIGDCLDSLLALEARDYEIVLVDDASTDATPRRLAQFKAAHGEVPVTIVRNARNLGVSGARNSGIVAARGRYLFFTDSDCAVSPRWLAAMLAGFDDPTISAVAGAVIDPPPRNWAEGAYFGAARIGQNRWQGRRLVGNNMGFRVEVLQAYMFDPAMNYYCDEDDIALRMREDGHRFAFAPEAVVRHDHPVTLKSYLKMALRQGVGSARLWYKHNRWLGRDLWPAAAALATLPWGLFDARLWTLPALCGLLQVAAILYNETQLKGKSRSRALQVLPVCLLYYACRIYAVARTLLTITLGGEQPVRRSKRLWRERRAPLAPPPRAKSPRRSAA